VKAVYVSTEVLPFPDGSELALVIYRGENGGLLFQPACYKPGQMKVFEDFIKQFSDVFPEIEIEKTEFIDYSKGNVFQPTN
jgi:hypothetical protein